MRTAAGALGLLLFAVALLRLWSGRETMGWRAAPAEVVGRDVPEAVLRPPPADPARDSTQAGQPDPAMRVRYRYVAERRAYAGSGTVRGTRDELLGRLEEYRPGARLVVYYAPEQPWRSALARAVGLRHWAALAGGLLLIAAAVWWPSAARRPNGVGAT